MEPAIRNALHVPAWTSIDDVPSMGAHLGIAGCCILHTSPSSLSPALCALRAAFLRTGRPSHLVPLVSVPATGAPSVPATGAPSAPSVPATGAPSAPSVPASSMPAAGVSAANESKKVQDGDLEQMAHMFLRLCCVRKLTVAQFSTLLGDSC